MSCTALTAGKRLCLDTVPGVPTGTYNPSTSQFGYDANDTLIFNAGNTAPIEWLFIDERNRARWVSFSSATLYAGVRFKQRPAMRARRAESSASFYVCLFFAEVSIQGSDCGSPGYGGVQRVLRVTVKRGL